MNDLYTIDNSKSTAPRPFTKTGTVDSFNYHIVGTGTVFLSQVQEGDYVVNYSSDEIRRVTSVQSNTLLAIVKPFSSDLSSANLVIIPQNRMPQYIILENNGAAQGSIDGNPFRSGSRKEFGSHNPTRGRVNSPDPMIVDATGTQIDVTTYQ